jgi:hypothetical protein
MRLPPGLREREPARIGARTGVMAVGKASAVPAVLTGATGAASERNKSPVAKEGAQLGDHVAYELGEFFARQGWVQPSAVPRPSPR